MATEAKNLWREIDKNDSQRQDHKRSIYLFLERPESKGAMIYHLLSFLLILGSLCVSVLSTMEDFHDNIFLMKMMLGYELALLAIFITEFLLRLWSCSYMSRYKGFHGRLRFMKSFYMIVDAFVITSTLVTAILQINSSYFTILRITRFMQILRILRIDRQRGDLQFMKNVVRQHSKELITCYFVGFIILFVGTYIVYICERLSEDDSKISNMADGLYWAMITVTSVGYGDLSPKTWPGKFVTGIFALTGCAFFALPAGILGSGFALQVDKQKKEKRYIKVRHPAAVVLQTFWRDRAIRKSNSGPTWFYLLPQLKDLVPKSKSQAQSLKDLLRVEFSNEKSKHQDDSRYNPLIVSTNISSERQTNTKTRNVTNLKLTKIDPFRVLTSCNYANVEILTKTELLVEGSNECRNIHDKRSTKGNIKLEISAKYRGALRFYMRLKYWRCIKVFQAIRYPYVNLQDIMEKASQDHMELLTSIRDMKESIEIMQNQFESMRAMMRDFNSNSDAYLEKKTPYSDTTIDSSTSAPIDAEKIQHLNEGKQPLVTNKDETHDLQIFMNEN